MKKSFLAILFAFVSVAAFSQGKFGPDGRFLPGGDYFITKQGESQTGLYLADRFTQRDSIPTWQRTFGMIVYAKDRDSCYQLKSVTLGNDNWFAFKLGSADVSGYVPTSRTLTINGTTYDLTANRSWTIAAGDTTSLSARIDLRVKYTDTAAMLANRLKISDTATMLSARPLNNRFTDSIAVIRALANTKGVGTVTGSGTSGQVGYWNGTSSMTGSSNLTWDNSNLRLVLNDFRLTASDVTSGLKQVAYYPNSGTNVGGSLSIIPRGTGFASTLRAQVSVFNTDFVADATNYEFATYRSTSDRFLLATGAAGTGTLRPLVFSSGGVGSPSTNTEQFVLFPSGRVGVKTFTDDGTSDLNVNGTFKATTLTVGAGASTIGGTLGVTGAQTNSSTINIQSSLPTQDYTFSTNTAFKHSILADNFSSTAALNTFTFKVASGSGTQVTPLILKGDNSATIGGTLGVTGATTLSNLAGTGTRAVEASSTGVLSATKIIDAGTYTPTVAAGSNCSVASGNVSQYLRVGNVVTVSGQIYMESTSASTTTVATMTLPISSSNFTSSVQAGGAGNYVNGSVFNSVLVEALNTSQTVRFIYRSDATNAAAPISFSFTYRII